MQNPGDRILKLLDATSEEEGSFFLGGGAADELVRGSEGESTELKLQIHGVNLSNYVVADLTDTPLLNPCLCY